MGVRQAISAPSGLDTFNGGWGGGLWAAALKVCLIHVVCGYKKALTRLKAKLNKLKVKDASGIFSHTLLSVAFRTGVIVTADFSTDARTSLNLLYCVLNLRTSRTAPEISGVQRRKEPWRRRRSTQSSRRTPVGAGLPPQETPEVEAAHAARS